jgi:hypothetical protein
MPFVWRKQSSVKPPLAVSVQPITVGSDRADSIERALSAHVNLLAEATRAMQQTTVSFINFAGLVGAGALTVGIIRHERLVTIFAPYAIAIVLCYLLQLYTDIERSLTHRELVEDRLNSLLGSPVFLGTSPGARRYRNRLSVRMLGALNAIPFLVFAGYSIQETGTPRHEHWGFLDLFVTNAVGLAVFAVVLVLAYLELVRVAEKTAADFMAKQ